MMVSFTEVAKTEGVSTDRKIMRTTYWTVGWWG